MSEPEVVCPLPLDYERIVMAHGGGGRLMQQLLDQLIRPTFANDVLKQNHDSAVLISESKRLAFTTDSYVVKPLFFPGGDIGKLAVCGTLNDLAMSGARPLYLSCSLIIEEGFAMADLQRVLQSMRQTADAAGVMIVTGDTKVVDHGKGDGLFINTAGIGVIDETIDVHPSCIQIGDAILVNSDLGRHGLAVMLEREGLHFDHAIASDCADLSGLVGELLASGIDVHCLRDLTRGGLATVLNELAVTAKGHFQIAETSLPIRSDVLSACEILGFDPLYMANEGAMVLFVPNDQAERALSVMHRHPLGSQASRIGNVASEHGHGMVTLETAMGISRVLDLLSGEQLPRIC